MTFIYQASTHGNCVRETQVCQRLAPSARDPLLDCLKILFRMMCWFFLGWHCCFNSQMGEIPEKAFARKKWLKNKDARVVERTKRDSCGGQEKKDFKKKPSVSKQEKEAPPSKKDLDVGRALFKAKEAEKEEEDDEDEGEGEVLFTGEEFRGEVYRIPEMVVNEALTLVDKVPKGQDPDYGQIYRQEMSDNMTDIDEMYMRVYGMVGEEMDLFIPKFIQDALIGQTGANIYLLLQRLLEVLSVSGDYRAARAGALARLLKGRLKTLGLDFSVV